MLSLTDVIYPKLENCNVKVSISHFIASICRPHWSLITRRMTNTYSRDSLAISPSKLKNHSASDGSPRKKKKQSHNLEGGTGRNCHVQWKPQLRNVWSDTFEIVWLLIAGLDRVQSRQNQNGMFPADRRKRVSCKNVRRLQAERLCASVGYPHLCQNQCGQRGVPNLAGGGHFAICTANRITFDTGSCSGSCCCKKKKRVFLF